MHIVYAHARACNSFSPERKGVDGHELRVGSVVSNSLALPQPNSQRRPSLPPFRRCTPFVWPTPGRSRFELKLFWDSARDVMPISVSSSSASSDSDSSASKSPGGKTRERGSSSGQREPGGKTPERGSSARSSDLREPRGPGGKTPEPPEPRPLDTRGLLGSQAQRRLIKRKRKRPTKQPPPRLAPCANRKESSEAHNARHPNASHRTTCVRCK